MFRAFKNLELLRYYVSSKVEKSIQAYAKQNQTNTEQITGTVFSAAFALVVAYISKDFFSNDFFKVVGTFILFIICYIIIYLIYKLIYKRVIVFIFNKKIHSLGYSSSEIKDIIDDFDHIACDNVLVAHEFMRRFNAPKNIETTTFYFYEIIYYLRTAITRTKIIATNSDKCINSSTKCDAIDLYRLINICKMMEQVMDFIKKVDASLNTTNPDIRIDKELETSLKTQFNDLEQDLKELDKKCNELRETMIF